MSKKILKTVLKEVSDMYLLKTDEWYLERLLFLMGGIMTLLSAILAWINSPYRLILTILVGLNQLVFAFAGFCPSAIIFHKLGISCRLERPKTVS
jgi:hypothetical protein